ncbi:PPK2 family polyphosphate kinase [Helcobacillus massiliensis]|uniref:PPK2 family polyphosphate:nucleotide phosphotransferase n=1 Tax=Helcobacillus massiliensis TaxID=521392 RepID=A0A839QT23_9MICO|nr:PPK2 family polyphosphate kinase [Helcobacillus massiliensis]MBB3022798.1 PPK2 family polyphosphate:nucleotide phosphotransferase [Helcobacillus massiliensis]
MSPSKKKAEKKAAKKSATRVEELKKLDKKAAKKAAKKAEKKKAEQKKVEKKAEKLTAAGFCVQPSQRAKVSVRDIDPRSTPGFDGDKAAGQELLALQSERLSELQERLWAAHSGRVPGRRAGRSVLLVVQGMDTSGKGGIMRHVVGAVDPQGVDITAFKAPTEEEKSHHFLWRVRPHQPEPGMIGVFDRSHYEDVLIHRVHGWADDEEIAKRYRSIKTFEKEMADDGVIVLKVMLHISKDKQWERLFERLQREDKHWKFAVSDLTERKRWDDYMDAYDAAIAATSTRTAPWHIIPADRKWYARLAVQNLLIQALEDIDPQWPKARFDVEKAKQRMLDEPGHPLVDDATGATEK